MPPSTCKPSRGDRALCLALTAPAAAAVRLVGLTGTSADTGQRLRAVPGPVKNRESTGMPIPRDPLVAKAPDAIRSSPPDVVLTVPALCGMIGVSREILRKRMLESMETSPKQEIDRVRLMRVKMALVSRGKLSRCWPRISVLPARRNCAAFSDASQEVRPAATAPSDSDRCWVNSGRRSHTAREPCAAFILTSVGMRQKRNCGRAGARRSQRPPSKGEAFHPNIVRTSG